MDLACEIDRGIELLALCQALQSEKDGIERPAPLAFDKRGPLDQFAKDICAASANMAALHRLIPLSHSLAELGRKLEADGKLRIEYGEDYAIAVLKHVRAEHGL